MTVEDLLKQVRADLRGSVDPGFRAGMLAFFREPIDPYGVRGKDVQQIARRAYHEVKFWPEEWRTRFARELWKSGRIEEGSVATYVYRRFTRTCGAAEFEIFERWIDRYVHNWANCDGVASWLLAASIANQPELVAKLHGWTGSRNRWKRRAAIVSLLQEAKHGRNTDTIFAIADALIEDNDDLVQKGVGWVLKEAYPKRPAEVMEFLEPRRNRASRQLLRIAAEKMNTRDRGRAMAKGL